MKKFYMMLAAVAALTVSANAQDVLTGTINVGDYDNATNFYNGSYFDMAPANFYLNHYGSQMLYLYDTDFTDFEGKNDVKITKISYKFYDQAIYNDITANVKYYLQLVDETEFQTDNSGNKLYFDCFSTEPVIEGEFYYEAFSAYGEDVEMTIDLSNAPFAITPGKNLVVTAVIDMTGDCTASSDDAPFYTSGISNRAMTYSDNNISFTDYANDADYPKCSSTYSGGGTRVNMPVTKIEYTYTESTPTAITEIESEAQNDAPYYDLMGRKMSASNLPAGIYIHGGKKVIVK
jgi:hypothetical protein